MQDVGFSRLTLTGCFIIWVGLQPCQKVVGWRELSPRPFNSKKVKKQLSKLRKCSAKSISYRECEITHLNLQIIFFINFIKE
ncbi:hypothetical protein BTJ39_05875 [Izhakiella australiensis]|uniref:Uncharacterized protein n=1 Tax=Izhakiella australiensis TaxID=1926881 RepID=A0A1S8YRN8_9GAMM|nr:hypothetical protein BTJ39_05875 [Izhakiella australiensis]